MPETPTELPLAGIRVLDFGHMVMGPSCGLVLADLGAEVVRIEPVGGDPTRHLTGFASGFFCMFNRNKQSVSLDLKSEEGMAVVRQLLAQADVVLENFGPGAMERLGLGWEAVHAINPRTVYCQLKGYLPGPYEEHMALDEVVQMQGGLAYMTGPRGQPLRAGASVVDIGGGMFGAIAILAALHQRHASGKGSFVQSGLFETTAFFVGQHMATSAITGQATQPMPTWREPKAGPEPGGQVSSWSIYRTFEAADGTVFIGVTSEQQWARFCQSFGLAELAGDPDFAQPAQRRQNSARMLQLVEQHLARMPVGEVVRLGREARISVAPVARPDDLFDDPHLNAGGGLAPTRMRGGRQSKLPTLPIAYNGARFGLRLQPPDSGADNAEVLGALGYTEAQIAAMRASRVIGT